MNENNLEIYQADISDLYEIFKYAVQIVEQHQKFNPLRFSTLENHHQLLYEFFKAELADSQSIIPALTLQKSIVGYALIKMEDANLVDLISARAWLHDIYIDESVRGLGGGKMLLDAAKNAARQLGSESLMLHVAVQNTFAQELFKKHGFEMTVSEMMYKL